jgi:hypothetical protein
MARGILKIHRSRRNAMTKMAQQHSVGDCAPNNGAPIQAIPPHARTGDLVSGDDAARLTASMPRHPALTAEQVFRLWRCAIKDDEQLVDELIERVYQNILAFNDKRAESVIELMCRRSMAARWAFHTLLKDMEADSACATSHGRAVEVDRRPQRPAPRSIAR